MDDPDLRQHLRYTCPDLLSHLSAARLAAVQLDITPMTGIDAYRRDYLQCGSVCLVEAPTRERNDSRRLPPDRS
jgi:hypothetical protein